MPLPQTKTVPRAPLRPVPSPPARLHLSPPHQDGRERELLDTMLASNWIAPAGPLLAEFEAAISDATGFPFVLAVNSGTAALTLAYRELDIGPGDEVWTTMLTFIATVGPAVQMGATVRFLDVDPASWTLQPEALAAELAAAARRGRLPRAIVPVDIFGQPTDLDALGRVAAHWGVPVISDSACSLGSTMRGRHAGRGARVAVFSFNGNKIVTTGGGGALVSETAGPIARARHLANQAREPAAHFQHETTGHSCLLPSPLAAIGLAQIRTLAERVEARRRIFLRYVEGLCDLPGIEFMPEIVGARSNRWLSVVLFDPRAGAPDRDDVFALLAGAGIESRPVWKPLHLQPAFRSAPTIGGSVAAWLFDFGLCLPSGSGMTEDEQNRVIAVLRSAWP